MKEIVYQVSKPNHVIHTWIKTLTQPELSKIQFLQVEARWHIGKEIQLQLTAAKKEKHGTLLDKLTIQLQNIYGKIINKKMLKDALALHNAYPKWEGLHSNLAMSHYRTLCKIKNDKARFFYTEESGQNNWTVEQLKRQVATDFYHRASHNNIQSDRKDKKASILVKDMYILEFLNLANEKKFLEKHLEDRLVEKLQSFLMELGNGFSFIARQKRIMTASGKQFFIDLVFYHFQHKCFVIIELKAGPLSHRDIGQLDMYVRLFDEKWKDLQDNPTIGIIFCSEKDPTVEKYSVLKSSPQLFAASYRFEVPEDKQINQKVKDALERIEWLDNKSNRK